MRRSSLAGLERHGPEVAPVHVEYVERIEHGPGAGTLIQQPIELRGALVVHTHDLTVEDRVLVAHGVGELLGELRELQRVAVAGDQAAVVAVDAGERAEAV